jgi:hypothetical protein
MTGDKMKGVLENDVLQGCIEYLTIRGIYCWRNNTGAVKNGKRFIRFGFPGSSDIIGILPDGRFLAVECKREKGGVLSAMQKSFLSAIEKNNGVAIVANSVQKLAEELNKKL